MFKRDLQRAEKYVSLAKEALDTIEKRIKDDLQLKEFTQQQDLPLIGMLTLPMPITAWVLRGGSIMLESFKLSKVLDHKLAKESHSRSHIPSLCPSEP